MKKLFVAIFSVFYLGLSSGATVHLHYCMGKLVEWNFRGDKKNDKCGKCGMPLKGKTSKKHCCKNEKKLIKIVNDQQVSHDYSQAFLSLVEYSAPLFIELSVSPVSSDTEKNPVSHAPPGTYHSGIYLFNCTFRI